MKKYAFMMLLGLVLSSINIRYATAQIYKLVDEEGRVTYSPTPLPGSKPLEIEGSVAPQNNKKKQKKITEAERKVKIEEDKRKSESEAIELKKQKSLEKLKSL